MNKIGILVVVLSALLLSVSSVFIQYAYDAQSNPQTIVFVRYLAFIPFAVIVLMISKKTIKIKTANIAAVYLGGFFFSIGSACLMISIYYLPISLAILTLYTFPLLTMLFSNMLDRQIPEIRQLLCFVFAFLGLMLALNSSIEKINFTGIAFALAAAICISIAYLISDRKLKHLPALLQTLHFALCGVILALIFLLATQSLNWGDSEQNSLIYIAGACITFAVSFFGMFAGVQMIGVVETTMTMNLEPVFTIILAVLMLGEQLNNSQYLGAVMVVASITVLQLIASKPPIKTNKP